MQTQTPQDEELVVNELQAYMCTERHMFSCGAKNSSGSGGGGGGGRHSNGGGGGGGASTVHLANLQLSFTRYIAPHLPNPPSVGSHTKVVWLDA